MPAIKISTPHNLVPEEAKKRIVKLISESKIQFGNSVSDVNESWVNNCGNFSFRAMGFSVSGFLQVKPATVDVEINLPFAALLFKSRIEKVISEKASELLA